LSIVIREDKNVQVTYLMHKTRMKPTNSITFKKKIGNKSLVESKQITLKLVLIYRNHTLAVNRNHITHYTLYRLIEIHPLDIIE